MSEGDGVTSPLIIGLILIVYGAISAPLDRRGITSAMAFVAVGFVLGASGLGLLDGDLESVAAERVTELALVFLLFTDSARLDLASLRRDLRWPGRLLLVGLPLTMVLGFGVGLLLFPGIGLASAFLLSTMLCSTDAALGQRVVDDLAVPARVRQALDVESGLNDGLAVPFFLVAMDISLATCSRVGCRRRSSATPRRRSAGASSPGWAPASSAERSSASPNSGTGPCSPGGARCSRWPWR